MPETQRNQGRGCPARGVQARGGRYERGVVAVLFAAHFVAAKSTANFSAKFYFFRLQKREIYRKVCKVFAFSDLLFLRPEAAPISEESQTSFVAVRFTNCLEKVENTVNTCFSKTKRLKTGFSYSTESLPMPSFCRNFCCGKTGGKH